MKQAHSDNFRSVLNVKKYYHDKKFWPFEVDRSYGMVLGCELLGCHVGPWWVPWLRCQRPPLATPRLWKVGGVKDHLWGALDPFQRLRGGGEPSVNSIPGMVPNSWDKSHVLGWNRTSAVPKCPGRPQHSGISNLSCPVVLLNLQCAVGLTRGPWRSIDRRVNTL